MSDEIGHPEVEAIVVANETRAPSIGPPPISVTVPFTSVPPGASAMLTSVFCSPDPIATFGLRRRE